jgi:hypothetical protein
MTSPVDDYLRELRASLRARPQETQRIIAEAEDHLAQSVAAGLAAGLSEVEAQEAAISAFGSVNAVVRAHRERRTLAAVAEDLFMSAWQLGGVGLAAIGVSGVVAAIMNATLGRAFVGQAPPGVRFPAASCKYWLSAWQEAHTCAQAAMLESSSDAVVLRVIAGIAGVAVLEGFFIVRYIQRRRGHWRPPLLRGRFPLVAGGVFAAGAAALSLMQITGLEVKEGPGSFISGIIVAAAVAAGYAVALRRRRTARSRAALPHLALPVHDRVEKVF